MRGKQNTISFSAPMVMALRAGLKTQTRRLMAVQPELAPDGTPQWRAPHTGDLLTLPMLDCPYAPTMGVREAVWIWCQRERDGLTPTGRPKYRYVPVGRDVVYHADHPGKPRQTVDDVGDRGWRLKIARFMPRWASRMTIELVGSKAEPLQQISELDAVAEGIAPVSATMQAGSACGMYYCRMPDGKMHYDDSAYDLYRKLWEQINGIGSWQINPWVWALSLRIAECRGT